ncbi:unnamed protein product, partial [Meganyctiphanes norvegica]
MEDPELKSAIQAKVIVQQGPSTFFCTLCQETCIGNIQNHVRKDSHRNILSWEAVNNATPSSYLLSSLPEVVRNAKQNNDIQALDRGRFEYVCKVCSGKKPFFGLLTLQDHLKGKDHNKVKKLIQMTSATQIRTETSNPSEQKVLAPGPTPPQSQQPPDVQTLLRDKTVQIVENNGVDFIHVFIIQSAIWIGDIDVLLYNNNGKKETKETNKPVFQLVSDSQGMPQPEADMEWNNSDSSQVSDSQAAVFGCMGILTCIDRIKSLILPLIIIPMFGTTFLENGNDDTLLQQGNPQLVFHLALLLQKYKRYRIDI